MRLKPRQFRKPRRGHWATKGLKFLMLGNEGSGNKVFDLSGNGSPRTLAGDVSWSSGDYGSQLTFPGTDDYIDLSNTKISNWDNSNITLVVRFSTTSVAVEQRIFARGDTAGNNPTIQLVGDGTVRGIVGAGGGDGGSGIKIGSSVNILANTKYDLALTFDKLRMKLYLDGVEKADDAAITIIGSGEETTYIGARTATIQSDFLGDIEFFYIYNSVKSASEIAELYREPFGMFERDSIELWVGATSVGVAPEVANPKGPLGHPLCGAFAGPISF